MLCESCGKKNATTQIKTILNGELTEYHLCSGCAEKMGYGDLFSDFSFGFSNMLSSFFGNALPERSGLASCKMCGATFRDILNTGKVGCSQCYETFYKELLPSINRIHGNTSHNGKVPQISEEASEMQSLNAKIQDFEIQLQKAIEAQDFEQAAKLRDEIKEMKTKRGDL
ncbi:MAG: UvrB/UvrC motif-containing protein [Bacillota bacterium]|nr:UvrB/UvrC motif-containing protein [Bacillota bacterium]